MNFRPVSGVLETSRRSLIWLGFTAWITRSTLLVSSKVMSKK